MRLSSTRLPSSSPSSSSSPPPPPPPSTINHPSTSLARHRAHPAARTASPSPLVPYRLQPRGLLACQQRRLQCPATLQASPTPDPAPSSSTCWGSLLRTSQQQPWSLGSSSTTPPYQPFNTTTTVATNPSACERPQRPRPPSSSRPSWRPSPRRPAHTARPPLTRAACRIHPTGTITTAPPLQRAPLRRHQLAATHRARTDTKQTTSSRRAGPSAHPLSRARRPSSPAAASRTRRQPPWVSA